jgi:hypothetical protein
MKPLDETHTITSIEGDEVHPVWLAILESLNGKKPTVSFEEFWLQMFDQGKVLL